MRRWGPPLLTVIGLAIGITGWWLYATIDPDPDGYSACRVTALYSDLIHGTGDLSHCQPQSTQLYLSLLLLVLGPLVFLAGWLLTLSPRLDSRTRLPGWATASGLLVVLVGLGVGGQQLWQQHRQSVREHREHLAEAALARLEVPAAMRLPLEPHQINCFPDPHWRCGVSELGLPELAAQLQAMVHGTIDPTGCPSTRRRLPAMPCPTFMRGTLAGYPVAAAATPRLVTATPGKPVPHGVQIWVGSRPTNLYYVGTSWEITLAPLAG